MMSATFAISCDACDESILVRSLPDIGTEMDVPSRTTVLGMDLCDNCKLKAQMAVRSALGMVDIPQKRVIN